MPYIAHAGVQLSEEYSAYKKNHWYHIKEVKGLNYHWRINDQCIYEVACELFENKQTALIAAKYIYVTVVYNLLKKDIRIKDAGCQFYEKSLFIPGVDGNIEDYPESSFFWTPNCIGGGIGPDVYQVPNSFEDYDELYSNSFFDLKVSVSRNGLLLDFDNYDKSPFIYSKMVQPLLNTIVQADSVWEIGLQMTLYCGLLEHMAEDKPKHPKVLSEIDLLVDHVVTSSLSDDDKNSLVSFLNSGKTISSKQKCKLLCQQYAQDRYGPYTTKQILDDAYSIRSAFSHGEDCGNRYSGPAPYIKLVVLDILAGYAKDHD